MRLITLFLGIVSSAIAGTQSVTLINGSFPLANSAPFNSVGDNTLTMRIHNWSAPGSTQIPFCLPAGTNCVSINSSSFFVTQIFKDTMSGGGQPSVSIAGIPDFIARLSRNTVAMIYTLEIFNVATGTCSSASNSISALGANNWSGSGGNSGVFDAVSPTARMAYLRWGTGVPTTICANMPLETDAPANLLDFEFEGSPADTSGNSVSLSGYGSATYNPTPTYAPTCQGQDPIAGLFTANVITTNIVSSVSWVKCISESVGSALTYTWTKGTCPNSTLTSTTAAFPNVIITVAGQCVLNLSVTDGINTAMVVTTLGAPDVDGFGNIITGNAILDKVKGPMKRYGLSPWPYFDPAEVNWAQHIGGILNGPRLANAVVTGVVNGTPGTTTVTYKVIFTDAFTQSTAALTPSTKTFTTAAATLTGVNSLTLNWSAPTAGTISTVVYRTAAGGTPNTTGIIATLSPGTLTFTDTGVGVTVAPPPPTTNSTGSYLDQWNIALAGTVTMTDSTHIVGSGTDFQNQYCDGGTMQAPNQLFIAWIPDGRAVGGTRRVLLGGSGMTCVDATHITLSFAYGGTLGTGIQYSYWDAANNWVGMSENNNYYDVCMAFYDAYYRTQYTIFHTYAQTFCDRWFTFPYFDQGLTDPNVNVSLFPRIVAYTGMAIREQERSNMLVGLDAWADSDILHWNFYGDVRETAYVLSVFAINAIIDPPGSHQTAMQAQTATFVSTTWANQVLPDGSFTTTLQGDALYVNQTFAPSASISGTITATLGNSVFLGVGTNFLDPAFLPSTCVFTGTCDLWLTPSNANPANSPYPKDNTGGDNTTFHVTVIDATHLQADRNYDGILAGSGRGFQVGTQLGWGVQPFHMGVVAAAMSYSYVALTGNHNTEATQAKGFAVGAAKWIAGTGTIGTYMSVAYNGLFYARNYANCITFNQAITDINCTQDLTMIQGIRYLNMEVMHGFSAAYQISLDSTILAGGNLLYGAAYGCLGGPFSDAICLNGSLDPGSFEWTTYSAKTFGFSMGWGEGGSWPAVITLPLTVSSPGFFGKARLNGSAIIR